MVLQFNLIVGFMVGFEVVWSSPETVTTVVVDLGVIRVMIYTPEDDED